MKSHKCGLFTTIFLVSVVVATKLLLLPHQIESRFAMTLQLTRVVPREHSYTTSQHSDNSSSSLNSQKWLFSSLSNIMYARTIGDEADFYVYFSHSPCAITRDFNFQTVSKYAPRGTCSLLPSLRFSRTLLFLLPLLLPL
jgi:hypothetical protein